MYKLFQYTTKRLIVDIYEVFNNMDQLIVDVHSQKILTVWLLMFILKKIPIN